MKEMNREEIEKVAEMVAEKASEKLGLETVVRTIDKVDRKRKKCLIFIEKSFPKMMCLMFIA